MVVERTETESVNRLKIGDIFRVPIQKWDTFYTKCVVADILDDIDLAVCVTVNTVFNRPIKIIDDREYQDFHLDTELGTWLNRDFYQDVITDNFRNMIVPDKDGVFISIPSEKEIFGINKYGEDEGVGIRQWPIMKNVRSRIALSYEDERTCWYLLRTKSKKDHASFCDCGYFGGPDCVDASISGGVRLRFLMPVKV